MKILKQIFIVVVVAAIAFSLSAPFLTIERWLGFCVLTILAAFFFLFRAYFRIQNRPVLYAVGFVAALLFLVPASFFAQLMESGFDDGPFVGKPFVGNLKDLKASDSLKFRDGTLIIYNRSNKAPVIAYLTEDRTQWATEMYVSMTPGAKGSELYHISKPSVSKGIVRDRLDFIGQWTYGAEHGYAYIWKFGGIQRFYLSW